MPSDDVINSKVVRDVHIPSKTTCVIKDTSVGSDTLIIDEVHMPPDSTSDDVNEIIELNTPIVPSKSFEFPCTEYSFIVVPINSSSNESPKFLVMIQLMVYGAAFFFWLFGVCV